MNAKNYQLYTLTQGCCDLDVLTCYLQNCLTSQVHFINPVQLTHALGAVYWQRHKQDLAVCFPEKDIYFWMTYLEAPGLAMGGLRLGVRHIIYQGHFDHLRKLQSLGKFYQARIISSDQDI